MWTLETYQTTLYFAAQAHGEQKMPGSTQPYVVHLSTVCMTTLLANSYTEGYDTDFAMQCALLHDTIEDTHITFDDIEKQFGRKVAEGVLALTKNETLDKSQQMSDSLERIRQQPKEVWAVKLADRITNLQKPPHYWSHEKCLNYQNEARLILEGLRGGNTFLEKLLERKINDYGFLLDDNK